MNSRLTDLWRRIVPGTPKIDGTSFYAGHSDLPKALPRHELALVGGDDKHPKWAVFECPCGTGHRIAVPLTARNRASWRVSRDANGQPSLHPSIDSADGARCHFWLSGGRVRWSPSRTAGRRAPLNEQKATRG